MQNFSNYFQELNASCTAQLISFKDRNPDMSRTDMTNNLDNILRNCVPLLSAEAQKDKAQLATLINVSVSDIESYVGVTNVSPPFPISCVLDYANSISNIASRFEIDLLYLLNSLLPLIPPE